LECSYEITEEADNIEITNTSEYCNITVTNLKAENGVSFYLQDSTKLTLNSPSNQKVINDVTPDFNFTMSGKTLSSYPCELFINDTGYGTATANNNTPTIITANQSLSDGTYDWYINCSVGNDIYQSAIREITIDATSPIINWLKLIIINLGNTISTLLKINAYDSHIDTAKFDTTTNSSWSNNQTTLDINDLLSQSGTVYVNDSAANLDTCILNYTLTNNSYYQNTSFNANLSEQRIYKNDTLYNVEFLIKQGAKKVALISPVVLGVIVALCLFVHVVISNPVPE